MLKHIRNKLQIPDEETRWLRPERTAQITLLLAVVAACALCFMASAMTEDVWDATYRITWLILTSASLLVIFLINRRPGAIKLRHVLLVISAVLTQMLLMMGIYSLYGFLAGSVTKGQALLVLPYMLAPTVVAVMIGRSAGIYVAFCTSLVGLSILPSGCPAAIQFDFLAISLPAGIASAFFSGRVHKREQILLSGIVTGLLVYCAAFALLGLRGNGLEAADGLSFSSEGFRMGHIAIEFIAAVGVNFILSALIGGLSPALERLFNISTPITWLEWADMNHPLLKKLQIAAPGTFHHSLVVQRLAEAAAEAIGADVTRSGVCALYHDIGKTKNPQYFAENLADFSTSPHNELTPEASARIIISHVTEGSELAQMHHLNKRIINVIREHHGVSTAYFFYRKAMDQYEAEKRKFDEGLNDTCPEEVDRSIFTYPGPIPQTRESGIVSMADAVESATRSLVHPTEADIREMINGIFKGRILDGHLQDCGLTLGEIAIMKETFFSTIRTMHHNRIAYPKHKEDDAVMQVAERRREERSTGEILAKVKH